MVCFSVPSFRGEHFVIHRKEDILNDEERLADLMNKNFINITKNQNLKPSTCNTTTDFDCVRKTCENHISVKI